MALNVYAGEHGQAISATYLPNIGTLSVTLLTHLYHKDRWMRTWIQRQSSEFISPL